MATIETWTELTHPAFEQQSLKAFHRVSSAFRARFAREVSPPSVPPFLMLEHLINVYIADHDAFIATTRDKAIKQLVESGELEDLGEFKKALDYFARRDINILHLLSHDELLAVTSGAVIEAYTNTSEVEECGIDKVCLTSLQAFYAVSEQPSIPEQPPIPSDATRSAFNF